MKVLAINAGSSSLKFQMYEMPEEKVLISGLFERIGINNSGYTLKVNGEKIKKEVVLNNHEDAVEYLIKELLENNIVASLDEIEALGHRVVHGGDKYADSVVITDEVLQDVEKFYPLAPLHNPANVLGIKAFQKSVPNAVVVGVFDTAFHQTMEERDFLYGVPYEWYTDYKVRKYGFHGTSHKFLANRMMEILNKKDAKIITCHLGNGGSISAVKNGKCIDTSMGFTPNAGIIMGTRSGDIDVTIIPYIMSQTGKTLDEVIDDLNKKSGFLGICGISSDSRDVEDGMKDNNLRCILTHKMFVKSVVNYIASYYVALGGADAICFSAGIGENSVTVRKDIIEALNALGIKIDEASNNTRGKEALITSEESAVPCYIIPTDEELMIARDAFNLAK
ncbi:MAG: acetate kinase [Bacilli bacterium]|nr:acetate kinase [Bacilli bacterium]MDD4282940.1 acetate kinase [Bacilli bacterium]MDD4718789.1 acetate kinase [Bacilli bacterium]